MAMRRPTSFPEQTKLSHIVRGARIFHRYPNKTVFVKSYSKKQERIKWRKVKTTVCRVFSGVGRQPDNKNSVVLFERREIKPYVWPASISRSVHTRMRLLTGGRESMHNDRKSNNNNNDIRTYTRVCAFVCVCTQTINACHKTNKRVRRLPVYCPFDTRQNRNEYNIDRGSTYAYVQSSTCTNDVFHENALLLSGITAAAGRIPRRTIRAVVKYRSGDNEKRN